MTDWKQTEDTPKIKQLMEAVELVLPYLGPGPNMSEYGYFREDCALVHMDHFEGLSMASSQLVDALGAVTGEKPGDIYRRLVPIQDCDCASCIGKEAATKKQKEYAERVAA